MLQWAHAIDGGGGWATTGRSCSSGGGTATPHHRGPRRLVSMFGLTCAGLIGMVAETLGADITCSFDLHNLMDFLPLGSRVALFCGGRPSASPPWIYTHLQTARYSCLLTGIG